MVMAGVSGKGVPAVLFKMASWSSPAGGDGFMKDAEQCDDLTMRCRECRGRGEGKRTPG